MVVFPSLVGEASILNWLAHSQHIFGSYLYWSHLHFLSKMDNQRDSLLHYSMLGSFAAGNSRRFSWLNPIYLLDKSRPFLLRKTRPFLLVKYLAHFWYPLVMSNSSPSKDPPSLRTVNHLFLWAIYTMAMLVITRGYINTLSSYIIIPLFTIVNH